MAFLLLKNGGLAPLILMPCYFPFKRDGIPLPCGKCPYCLRRRATNWVFRCMQEAKVADTAHWVTFTYEQPKITPNGFMTLDKLTFQKFMKRLRKLHKKGHRPIKYFACGEYGDQTERPHYHAVIFNADIQLIEQAWQGEYTSVDQHTGEIYSTIGGILHFDQVNSNTVMYTAKYMMKKQKIPKFKGDDRLPQFQLFSKGLGINYLTPQTVDFHLSDITRLYATVDGVKVALPRYFREKIYTEEQRAEQALYAQAEAEQTYNKQYKEYLKFRFKGQTFEEFRYSRKMNALEHFNKDVKERDKL